MKMASAENGLERTKQLVHMAVAAGRRMQSSQTQMIHYNHRPIDYPTADTIPLYENLLFALALYRERTAESIAEANVLLNRVLNFQNCGDSASTGNFPLYLHQYPDCSDRLLGYSLLPVLYWILKQFSTVLGTDLSERTKRAAKALLQYCVKTQAETAAPPQLAVKVAASCEAFGRLWNDDALRQLGLQQLEQLRQVVEQDDAPYAFMPLASGQILVALQMVYDRLAASPWVLFWQRVCAVWNVNLASYVGPALQIFQVRSEPQVTLYDLLMGYCCHRFSTRALAVDPVQLQGILIQPLHDLWNQPALPFEQSGTVQGRRWWMRQTEYYGVALVQKLQRDPGKDNCEASFRLVWGDLNRAHSFVLQGGALETVDFSTAADSATLVMKLPTELPSEIKHRNREVALYVDHQEAMFFAMGPQEQKATTFQMGERVHMHGRGIELDVTVDIEQGDARFFGHLSPGNRPAQLNQEGPDRFAAFDRMLFLRTVSRSEDCRVRVTVAWGGQ